MALTFWCPVLRYINRLDFNLLAVSSALQYAVLEPGSGAKVSEMMLMVESLENVY